MKIRKKTYHLVDIGHPDHWRVWGEDVADKRKQYKIRTICSRCGKAIVGKFIVAMKKGHPNYLFHPRCFNDGSHEDGWHSNTPLEHDHNYRVKN